MLENEIKARIANNLDNWKPKYTELVMAGDWRWAVTRFIQCIGCGKCNITHAIMKFYNCDPGCVFCWDCQKNGAAEILESELKQFNLSSV